MAVLMKIDLNCDLGESFGTYKLGDDDKIMPYISSANIACGFHAGDPQIMVKTVRMAIKFGVAVGAHPGYPDLQGFGRRAMQLAEDEIESTVLYQIAALQGIAKAEGTQLCHVKPHGALYNLASINRSCANAIARAVAKFNGNLVLVALAGSELIKAGKEYGLRVANEGFPDRSYLPDGNLMPRNQTGSVLHDPNLVAENAVRLAKDGVRIQSKSSNEWLKVDTLCLHGDNLESVENANLVRQHLMAAGFEVSSL